MDAFPPPPDLLYRVTKQHRRKERNRRISAVVVCLTIAALAIGFLVITMGPLANKNKIVPGAEETTPSVSVAPWSPPWSIPPPPFDLSLSRQALAEALGIPLTGPHGCRGMFLDAGNARGWCIPERYSGLEAIQIIAGLRGESLEDPSVQEEMFGAIAGQARNDGDLVKAAEANWAALRPTEIERAEQELAAPPVIPAAAGEPTFDISDVSVTHPWVPLGDVGAEGRTPVAGVKPDPAFAGVSYSYRWSGETFPGYAECDIRLMSEAGDLVGRTRLQAYGNKEHPGIPEGQGLSPVFVTGPPVRAEFVCGPGSTENDHPFRGEDWVAYTTAGLVGPWQDSAGNTVPDGTNPADDHALLLHVLRGAEHCGWGSVIFLHTSWPLGTVTHGGSDWRQYVRDPDGALGEAYGLSGPYDDNVTLPANATYSGYHRGTWQLWTSPSDADRAVYLVHNNAVERWPRAPQPILCD